MKIVFLNQQSVDWQIQKCQSTPSDGLIYCPKCNRHRAKNALCPIGEIVSKLRGNYGHS